MYVAEFWVLAGIAVWLAQNERIEKIRDILNVAIVYFGGNPLSGEDIITILKVIVVLVTGITLVIIIPLVGLVVSALFKASEIREAASISREVVNCLFRYHRNRHSEWRYRYWRVSEKVEPNPTPMAKWGMKYHENIITTISRDLREILNTGYRPGELGSTIMLVGRLPEDSEDKLYIEFWENGRNDRPETNAKRMGFKKGDGYCGIAWRDGVVVGGTKKMLRVLPWRDRRYRKTSERQSDVKDFFCVPIRNYDEPDGSGEAAKDPFLFVLNLDSKEGNYFPVIPARRRAFVELLRPVIWVISFHVSEWKAAKDKGLA